MAKIKLTKLPFTETPEQAKALDDKLEELKSVPGGLMPALQSAQEIYGYLPIEVQKRIAEKLKVRPPFVTLVTRLMATNLSFSSISFVILTLLFIPAIIIKI